MTLFSASCCVSSHIHTLTRLKKLTELDKTDMNEMERQDAKAKELESLKNAMFSHMPEKEHLADESAAAFTDGGVAAQEAAGAAQTPMNLGKTCTCMHILRATSDPQGHHGGKSLRKSS